MRGPWTAQMPDMMTLMHPKASQGTFSRQVGRIAKPTAAIPRGTPPCKCRSLFFLECRATTCKVSSSDVSQVSGTYCVMDGKQE